MVCKYAEDNNIVGHHCAVKCLYDVEAKSYDQAEYEDKISIMWEALDKIANTDEYRILTAEEANNVAWKALASIDPHYGLSSFQREQKK